MVAIFNTNPSLRRTLNYNEQKVQQGEAIFLTAENYPLDNDKLSFQQKLNRLENQAALNENVTRNAIHISLNFDPSEQIERERLIAIANTYMEQIGLANLPYLVYQHFDAGHPHLHIVSVKIRDDGKRVDTQNMGRNQSEKARKAIEIEFGLVKAEDSKNNEKYRLEPVNVPKVQYGKIETKRAINNVLKAVLDTYKYSSLPELNAVLRLYNVMADRGGEQSNMYRNQGLSYRVLDDKGNKVGSAIKASAFFMKPTLKKLEESFKKNEPLKNPLRTRVKNAIDLALLKNPKQSLQYLIKVLEKEGIAAVLRQNEEGRIYGITYVDHKAKVVFNGSELGKQYSAKAILERCGEAVPVAPKIRPQTEKQSAHDQHNKAYTATGGSVEMAFNASLIDTLMQEENIGDTLPFELKRKKKKKKRLSNNQ
jgi:hypothetical protein